MKNRNHMPRVSTAALIGARPAGIVGTLRNDASDPAEVEKLLQKVTDELTRLNDDVKKTAEQAIKQSADAGELTEDLKAKADELLINQTKLTEAQSNLSEKMEALETRNHDLEQQVAARRETGPEKRKTVGQAIAESDDLKDYVLGGCAGSVRIKVQQAITSADGSAGDIIWSDRETEIVGIPRRRLKIRNLLTPGSTDSNLIEYAKMITRDNQAGMVSEGVQKPESNYVWDQASAAVRTIAHFVHVSRQAFDDAKQLQTEIDGELRYGLDFKEEEQLLTGDGLGQNISGLITEATAYVSAFAVTGETMIDQLRKGLLQATLAEYPADGIVLHPTDWARIELTKDTTLQYLFATIIQMAGPQLWGRPVVDTQSMTVDKFLCGAFRPAATIYDRMGTEVLISSEDRDNFIKNMYTIRGEKRLAMAIKRPAALIYGDFGNVSG
ncbi:MAG: phage major capsid protein [Alphaproteobacteria bacterium]|nr:phage major capsid protein [Alphaproteobacteria bacterium]